MSGSAGAGNTRPSSNPENAVPQSDPTHLSRRAVLGSFGTAAAIGAALATPAQSAPAPRHDADHVGIGPAETSCIESITRVMQDSDALKGFGYLTSVVGLGPDELFSNVASRSETTARFTAFGTATVTGRSILSNVFSIDAEGELGFYFDAAAGGADFGDPESFASGHLVALYAVRFQCINTVIAPNQGIFKLAADLRQRQADDFDLGGRRRRFGRENLRLRMQSQGSGIHDAPRASLVIASNFVVIQ
jgi:hypothetical protein